MEYEIYIRAEDGRHKLDNPPMSLEDAQEKANEWLGRIAEWTSETRAVSMYGQVLTIESIN